MPFFFFPVPGTQLRSFCHSINSRPCRTCRTVIHPAHRQVHAALQKTPRKIPCSLCEKFTHAFSKAVYSVYLSSYVIPDSQKETIANRRQILVVHFAPFLFLTMILRNTQHPFPRRNSNSNPSKRSAADTLLGHWDPRPTQPIAIHYID